MAIPANPASAFTPRPAVAEDAYPATIVTVVDLGTQDVPVFGKPNEFKKQRRVRVGFALSGEFDEQGKPRILGRTYNSSLHEKAGMRALIHAAEGKTYSDEAVANYDLAMLLGKNVTCNVVTKPRNDGQGEFNIVATVTKLTRGVAVEKMDVAPLYYSINDHGDPGENVPEWMRKEILKSYEYRDGVSKPSSASTHRAAAPSAVQPPPASGSGDEFDELQSEYAA